MVVLYLFFGLILRNARRAAVVVSAILFLFFSYGHFLDLEPAFDRAFELFARHPVAVNPHSYLIPLWAVVLLTVIIISVRSRRDFAPITAILNVVGFSFAIIPTCLILTSGSRYPGIAPLLGETPDESTSADPYGDGLERALHKHSKTRDLPTSKSPDIYYIILDAYGRQDVLKQYYGFDNGPFLAEMEKRGFYVARHSRPNYGQTVASIASSLNMNYLSHYQEQLKKKSSDLSSLHNLIVRNAVAAYLKTQGYRFITISTGFGLTAIPDADLVLGGKSTVTGQRFNPYEGLLLDLTPLILIPRTNQTLYDQHRDTILDGFRYLSNVARLPARKFVFAHLLVPHPPFVFGSHGEQVDQRGRPYSLADGSEWLMRGDRPEYRARYVAQLRFTNIQILKAIDQILAISKVRPIIIVQGDHGPRQYLNWHSLAKTDVRETFGNLSTFNLPDGTADKVFYDTISPVNSFGLLFDHVFGAHFKRFPDRSYYTTIDDPYKYVDVTDASKLPDVK